MALDATCQIRMNSELKAQVEELYRNLGLPSRKRSAFSPSRACGREGCRFAPPSKPGMS